MEASFDGNNLRTNRLQFCTQIYRKHCHMLHVKYCTAAITDMVMMRGFELVCENLKVSTEDLYLSRTNKLL